MQAPRQLRFSSLAVITPLSVTIQAFIEQAIDLEKSGAKVELKRASELELPEELQTRLDTEPALKKAKFGEGYQFLRKGYFSLDRDTSEEKMIFNRTVTLKDTWVKEQKKN